MNREQLMSRVPAAFAVSPSEKTSSRYNMISTANIIDEMEKAGFIVSNAKQSGGYSDREHKKHMVRFQPAGVVEANVGDVVPELVLVNSHDGKSSYQFSAGLFRKVCSNGLMVPQSTVGMIRVSHLRNPREVVDASFEIVNEFPKVLAEAGSFKKVEMTPEAQRGFAVGALAMRYGTGAVPVSPNRLLKARRHDDGGNDLWSVFNRVQENLLKGCYREYGASRWQTDIYGNQMLDAEGFRIRRRSSSVREVKSISEDVRLNKALWEMARLYRDGGIDLTADITEVVAFAEKF